MSLLSPKTSTLADDIVSQISAQISQDIPLLPKAFTRVLAKALAGALVLLFKYCGALFLQTFVAFASDKEYTINGRVVQPLVELGRLFGVGDPRAATRAEHTVAVTVTNQTGSLAAGSQLVFSATGVIYQTTAAVPLNAATVSVNVRASSDPSGNGGAGTIGNLQVGDKLAFANPLRNVATDTTVTAQTVTGADAEDIEEYRARILRRVQAKPQGGAYADYRTWAESVEGILHAYPYAGAPGEVDVYVEATVASSDVNGIPTAPQLEAVASAIELDEDGLASNRPVNAAVNVLPIARSVFDVELLGLDSPNEEATLDAMEEGLDEFLRSREPFIVGLSVLPRKDRVISGEIAGLVHQIAASTGATVTTVTLKQSGFALAAYTLTNGEKARFGVLTSI